MASLTIQEKIDNEAKKIEQAKDRMQKLVAQSKSQLKKDETRVKILLGAYLISKLSSMGELDMNSNIEDIKGYLTRDNDHKVIDRSLAQLINAAKERS